MIGASKKLLQAAAGNVEDDSGPVGVSFDGSVDYLSKSLPSGLATASKTFTFSAWVYLSSDVTASSTIFQWSTLIIDVNIPAGTVWTFGGYSSSYATILGWDSTTSNKFVMDTWNHILISIDLSNSSNRHVYVNDTSISGNYNTYSNTPIGFDVGGTATISSSSAPWKGRMAGVYLDTTYTDFSVESNRRDFIDADGFYVEPPSGGVISMPLANADTASTNVGSAGDFSVNGVLGTTERGPNEWNAIGVKRNDNSSYLDKNDFSNSNTTVMTISFNLFWPSSAGSSSVIYQPSGGYWGVDTYSGNKLLIYFVGAAGISWYLEGIPVERDEQLHIDIVYDGSNQSNCKVYVNNVDKTSTSTYTQFNSGRNVNLTQYSKVRINYGGLGTTVGEIWMDTTYTNLSSNPFWQSDSTLPDYNKPIPVRKVIEDTGVTPKIAMPMIPSNVLKNYGSAGNFVLVGNAPEGERGPSEYWQGSIVSESNNMYLNRTLSDQSKWTIATSFNISDGGPNNPIRISGESSFYFDNSGTSMIRFHNGNAEIVRFSNANNYTTSGWVTVLLSVDLTTNTAHCYLNGVSVPITANSMSSYSVANFDDMRLAYEGASRVGSFYMSSTYVDLSQKANRMKFFNNLGYPTNWTYELSEGNIDAALVLLTYSNKNSLGTNSGNGGTFTNTGGITYGGNVIL